MANTPVDSMKYGGMFWFTDLTLPDQYFALPVITSLTMWLTIEVIIDICNFKVVIETTELYNFCNMPLR